MINRMKSKLNSLKDDVRALRNEVGRDVPKFSSAESNAMIRSLHDNIPTDGPIPVERLSTCAEWYHEWTHCESIERPWM